jgi:DNA polymerase-3 subunit beta
MRFSCSRAKFADVLALLTGVVPLRSARPELQSIKLSGDADGSLTLTATDLEIGVRYRLEVDEMQDPGEALLPAAELAGVVREDWSETITVELSDGRATVTTQAGAVRLFGQPAEDYPAVRDLPGGEHAELPGEAIVDAVEKTVFAAARGDTRYALNGIYLGMEKGAVDFVASDTHRLSLSRKKSRRPLETPRAAIVITKGMTELAKLAAGTETVRLVLTEHELIAETPSATLVSRLVDGQFPRYQDVIPKELSMKATFSRDTLLRTLRLSGRVSNEETHAVRLSLDGDAVAVETTGSDRGEAEVRVPAEIEGEGLAISFNHLYLIDVLKILDDDSVTLQFKDGDSPARLDSGDFTHVLMPIRGRGAGV